MTSSRTTVHLGNILPFQIHEGPELCKTFGPDNQSSIFGFYNESFSWVLNKIAGLGDLEEYFFFTR